MYANGNTIGAFIGHDRGIGAIAGAIGRSAVVRFTLKLIAAVAFIVLVALIAFVMPVSADTISFGEIEPDEVHQELLFHPNSPSDFSDSVTFNISDDYAGLLVAIQVFSFGSGPVGSLLGLEILGVTFTEPDPDPDPQFIQMNDEGWQFQGILGPGAYAFDVVSMPTGTVGGNYAVVMTAIVPEPGTAGLMTVGLVGLGVLGRKRPN